MKILHTADWHLGKRLDRFDRMEEQRAVLEEICQVAEAEAVDAVVVAGDLFDTYNPPTEAVQLLFKTLKRLALDGRRPVIAIAGNHDSPDRIEAPDPLAVECGIVFAGFPHSHVPALRLETGLAVRRSAPGFVELSIPSASCPLRVILAPYANEGRLRKDLGSEDPEATLRDLLQAQWQALATTYCDGEGVNILVGHLLLMSQGDALPDEHVEEEKPILGPASVVFTQNLPEGIQYAALGHVHTFRNMGGGPCPAVYASSPLAFSFPKRGAAAVTGDRHVVILEAEPGQAVHYRTIPLRAGRALHRRLFPDVAAAVEWLRQNQDGYVELSIETEQYISAEDRKLLLAAHPRVVGPIPVFKDQGRMEAAQARKIDLGRGMEALFRDYYLREKGEEASADIMALLREVMGKEVEE